MSINDLVSYHTIAQTTDPWQTYASQKPKPHPTPEVSTYGAIMMTAAFTFLIYNKYLKRNKK